MSDNVLQLIREKLIEAGYSPDNVEQMSANQLTGNGLRYLYKHGFLKPADVEELSKLELPTPSAVSSVVSQGQTAPVRVPDPQRELMEMLLDAIKASYADASFPNDGLSLVSAVDLRQTVNVAINGLRRLGAAVAELRGRLGRSYQFEVSQTFFIGDRVLVEDNSGAAPRFGIVVGIRYPATMVVTETGSAFTKSTTLYDVEVSENGGLSIAQSIPEFALQNLEK